MPGGAATPFADEARLAIGSVIDTDVPGRLDRLPWSTWHWRVVLALGITWVLDGLEVTLVGSVASVLQEPDTLHLTESQIGLSASAYLSGAIGGSLLFGHLTDRLGRRKLFFVTLSLYLIASLATAFSTGLLTFACFRFFTGAGIGGEGSAINSAIDELLPARVRGRADLAINATYWLGAALGSAGALVLLNPTLLPHRIGWRLCFAIGAILGMGIIGIRRSIPESPRWLLMHGRVPEAVRVVAAIEVAVALDAGPLSPVLETVRIRVLGHASMAHLVTTLARRYLRRTALGLTLMVSQAFCYNAIFFTYALVLGRFYGVPSGRAGLYLLPFALGNLIGPFALGHLFDTVGRRRMIAITYAASAVLLAGTGYAFEQGWLTATSQTALWSLVFFFASSAASSAYLTVSELFPVELRGIAIAFFYAVGTAVGGLLAPLLFGWLIQSGSREALFDGYLLGAGLMLGAAAVALGLGVDAERRSLEDLTSDAAPSAA